MEVHKIFYSQKKKGRQQFSFLAAVCGTCRLFAYFICCQTVTSNQILRMWYANKQQQQRSVFSLPNTHIAVEVRLKKTLHTS